MDKHNNCNEVPCTEGETRAYDTPSNNNSTNGTEHNNGINGIKQIGGNNMVVLGKLDNYVLAFAGANTVQIEAVYAAYIDGYPSGEDSTKLLIDSLGDSFNGYVNTNFGNRLQGQHVSGAAVLHWFVQQRQHYIDDMGYNPTP